MIKFLKLTFVFTLFTCTQVFASITDFKANQGKVDFLAIGNPSALKIKGVGDGPTGELTVAGNSAVGKLSFQLNTLDTGINMRTKHMKDKYLQTEKFPTATLTITQLNASQDLTKGNYSLDNIAFTGTLNLHGTEKPVSGVASLSKKDSKIKVSAKFKINIQDYNIDIPSFAGIKVANDVDIDVQSTTLLQ